MDASFAESHLWTMPFIWSVSVAMARFIPNMYKRNHYLTVYVCAWQEVSIYSTVSSLNILEGR